MKDEDIRAVKTLATLLLTGIILGFWASNASADEWDIDALMKYSHTSDILRGCPFECDDPTEPTQDYVGFGFTVLSPRRVWEFDFTTGVKSIDCSLRHECPTESGTEFSVRFYPGRLRK